MASIEVSLSSFCLISRPVEEALETLSQYTAAVEFMNDGRHYTHDTSLLRSYPYHYTVHAPAHNINIASVLEPIRKASVELVRESLELAAGIDASRVVFHPGYFTFAEERDKAVAALQMSLAEINAFSVDIGVPCCVENMGNWGFFFLQTPADLPLVKGTEFCLDIGHAHECGTLEGFLPAPLTQIHVHDNDGTSDAHLALGKGTIGLDPVISAIRRNGIISPISECVTLEDAVSSKRTLEALLKS